MTVNEIAKTLGASVIVQADKAVESFYAGDFLSRVMGKAPSKCCWFTVMNNVNVAFFVLSAMTVTLYLIMYMLMYLAALKLRYTAPELPRTYRVPGGWTGIWLVTLAGLAGVGFAFVVGFFPPSNLVVGNPELYVTLVTAGTVIFTGIPWLIHLCRKPQWKNNNNNNQGEKDHGSAQHRSSMQ